jgi:hypothetical protein
VLYVDAKTGALTLSFMRPPPQPRYTWEMLVKVVLRKLDLGNSVAEFDADLESYFVETQTFRTVVQDKADIVAGDKGTGKTALYRILQARARGYKELNGITILPAFNPSGSPIFQRLTEGEPLDEVTYGSVWKTYVLALVGNWLLDQNHVDKSSRDIQIVEQVLKNADLRSLDHTALSVFARIVEWAKKKLDGAKSAQLTLGMPEGPSVTPKLEFSSETAGPKTVRYEEAITILDRALSSHNLTCWVALDRLDEAFHGAPAVEIRALRALFRVFLDLMPFKQLRLKLFVRRDLFRKVTEGGFVNLTHVNARKIEITWDEDDLKNLVCKRVRGNPEFLEEVGLAKDASNAQIFESMFPDQVDPGERKASTWPWMMSRIRDGNDLKPPRNLVDLVKKAQEAQMRREERESQEYARGSPIIGSEALKRGLSSLSEERVNDTLLAEIGEYAKYVQKFRDGKAEHNESSLAATLGIAHDQVRAYAKVLTEIGFLEQVGENYKIPMLYRDGLNVTQGKAF